MSKVQIPEAFEELKEPARYKVYWGGRGAAKSRSFGLQLLIEGMNRPMLILCAREIQKSIKDSVHSLLSNAIRDYGWRDRYEVLDNEIRGTNGTKFIFHGLWRNIDSIKSIEDVDVVWVEEANVCSNETWRTLIPSIRKPGSEIWVSFNPKLKTDAAYVRFVLNPPRNAIVKKVSFRDNPFLSKEFHDDLEDLKATDYDEYLHVYEGNLKQFADGAIFGTQLRKARDDNRICRIPIESGVPVSTFWDLGRNDETAIWFMQRVGLENRFIDYYSHSLVDLDHYAKILQQKGYVYDTHYLPHDVEVVNLGTGNRSRRQILESLGVKPIETVARTQNKMESIELTRQKFSGCWFDEERCEKGLDALANYQFAYDEKGETFRQSPLHNWASNGADAFLQFGQSFTVKAPAKTMKFASAW